MSQVEVSKLVIYPVKSMKGITLDKAQLTAQGLANDRRWMVVRENGRFVTQREVHRLALIETTLTTEGVQLNMPGHGTAQLSTHAGPGQKVLTKVWSDAVETVDAGPEISSWLTEAMESSDPLHLVRMAPGFTRPQGQPDVYGDKTFTYFADAAPFLVANERSLEALNAALTDRDEEPVTMNRFRPNIVVRGLDAFAEHEIGGLSGPGYSLGLRFPCERCVVTTINQETAKQHPGRQPFKTLAEINPMPGKPRAPKFAENAILVDGEGETISVGDQLKILDKN